MSTSSSPLNADPAELAKFSALASKWWDVNSEFAPLHALNPLRLKWISDQVPLVGKRAVDIGCGGGILAESMARSGAAVLGTDLADKPLNVARLHALECAEQIAAPLAYELISAEALAAREPSSFDVVTCMEMLEHVPDPESVVRACAALVKPGGWVFFSTINRNPKAFLFAIIGAEYVLNLLPKGTHEYAKFIKPSELVGAARRADLTVQAMTGLTYNPITKVYAVNGADTSVNYWLATRKPE
jgi:2-polyprenyl-6-hydroxyphenyl methylase / 3-demethylubiquinone-9 3-methyltransferase